MPTVFGVSDGGGSAAALLAWYSPTLLIVTLSMFLLGLFASIYHPAGVGLITHHTNPENRPMALGYHGIFGSAGLALVNWMYGFFVLPESLPPVHLDRDAFSQVLKITNTAGSNPRAVITGVSVQPMLYGAAYELIFGSRRDPVFGPVVVFGHCNAHTGVGDPYLPFREVLGQIAGDVESRWSAGALTAEQARRLWNLLPVTVGAISRSSPDLIDTLIAYLCQNGRIVRRGPFVNADIDQPVNAAD